MERHSHSSPSRAGVVLLDSQLRPVHFNAEAAHILGYPHRLEEIPSLEAVLPETAEHLRSPGDLALPDTFTSGRRQYVCRTFMLDHANGADRPRPKFVAILERKREPHVELTRWSEQHQLTSRERETVEHLLRGLSSKEIAAKMNISPSTVKSFLKLVMVKVGATSRAGILAKMHDSSFFVVLSVMVQMD